MKVGYQGAKGAYSEAAIYKHFEGKTVVPVGHQTFEDVFDALDTGLIDMALLPIENSIVGSVTTNMDLLFKHDFFVTGEEYLPVEHSLLSIPEATLEDIKYVYSHPVALDQCRSFLKKHNIEPIASYDTAGSAKIISKKSDIKIASISSSLCCKHYNLKELATNIQDTRNNFTRFFLFSESHHVPVDLKMEKSTLAFNTKHHPGALLNCLNVFAAKNINLSKLESRPIPANPFDYTFFIDLIGSVKDQKVIDCIEELKQDADGIKILGSYPINSLNS